MLTSFRKKGGLAKPIGVTLRASPLDTLGYNIIRKDYTMKSEPEKALVIKKFKFGVAPNGDVFFKVEKGVIEELLQRQDPNENEVTFGLKMSNVVPDEYDA